MRILGAFIGIIILLWLVWYFMGGPTKYQEGQGPYLKPPAPLDTGETYGDPEKGFLGGYFE